MIDTIIFSMDGVLLDTKKDLFLAVNKVMDMFGYPHRSEDEIRKFAPGGIRRMTARSLPSDADIDDEKKCYHLIKKIYTENCTANTRPFDGIIELLFNLKNEGFNLCTVSNKNQEAVTALNEYFFNEYINIALGDCHSVRKKPDPSALKTAVKMAGGDKAVMIGGSIIDVQAADNFKIPCILTAWGYGSHLRDLDRYVASSPENLLDSIMKMK